MMMTFHSQLLILVLALGLTSAVALAESGDDNRTSTQPGSTSAQGAGRDSERPLTPLTVKYSASMDKGVSISGSGVRTLSRAGDDTWRYKFDVDSFIADIQESLLLRWEDNRVIPLKYHYRLSGFLIRNRETTIDFDWEKGVATGRHEGESFSLDLKEGALDPLGGQLQLHQDIKAGKTEMVYDVIDKGRYDEDRFAVVGEETLDTRKGGVKTLKVEKVRDEDSDRRTEIWFEQGGEFLMMRLLQVEPDGSRYEITFDEADVGG